MSQIILILVLFFGGASCKTIAQTTQVSHYNSQGKKTGFWTERDTLNNLIETTFPISHFDSSGKKASSNLSSDDKYVLLVYRNEGNYNNGLRTGLWKYYINDTLAKEITYYVGRIVDAKIFNTKGKLQTQVTVDQLTDFATIKEFSINNSVKKTYSLPTYLLHLEHNY